MSKRSLLAAVALVGLGGFLGYAAASGKLSPNQRADAYRQTAGPGPAVNPAGPSDSWDPNERLPTAPKRVMRGGSFLCHVSYCESYRPAARRGTAPDTGMSHVGFRCVKPVGP